MAVRSTFARVGQLLSVLWLILFTLALSARASDLGVTADFDGDGRCDRALRDQYEPSVIRIWLSKSGRTAVVRTRTAVSAIAATDLDGDRRAELVTADATTRLQIWTKRRGGFRTVRVQKTRPGIQHVPRHRTGGHEPSPNDLSDVTSQSFQALIVARYSGPRAPDAHVIRAAHPDTALRKSDASFDPSAPRPPPALALL